MDIWHFPENEQKELITSRKTINKYVTKNIIEDFKQKIGFWKTDVCHNELNMSILKEFSDEINGDINKCDFFDIDLIL